MTRTSSRHVRPSKKTRTHHYRPRTINISELRTKQVTEPPRVISATVTRTSSRHVRPSKKTRTDHYRPRTINISELRTKPVTDPPRVMYVTSPFYEQMEYGEKTVEARPNYPCLKEIVPGTVVEFKNRSSGCSFLARITSRSVHHDFATMLRKETIQSCLPDHDPENSQRAVNTYQSFRHDTCKFIARRHGVVSFRFTLCFTENNVSRKHISEGWGEYDKNSLCSIFEAVERRYPRFVYELT